MNAKIPRKGTGHIMKEVIERLVEIEKKAHSIIDNSSSDKVSIERKKKADIVELEEKLKRDNEEKLEQLRIRLEKETQPEIDLVYKESNEHLKAIETEFYFDRKKMVDEVFERIIR